MPEPTNYETDYSTDFCHGLCLMRSNVRSLIISSNATMESLYRC